MLAAVGVGRRGVRRARLLELVGMVVPALLLGLLAAWVLTPMAPRLLDPQRRQEVPFTMSLDPLSLGLTAAFGLGCLVLAAVVVLLRSSAGSEEEVLRAAE